MPDYKNIKPISYIKANAAKVLDHVNDTRAPYIVTQNGEARGVILDTETFQMMQDGLKLFKLFAQSEAEFSKGKTINQKDLFDSLEKELNALEENHCRMVRIGIFRLEVHHHAYCSEQP